MTDTGIDYFDDPAEQDDLGPMTLERLTKMAENARDLEKTILEQTKALMESQDKHKNILRNLLPSAMEELGVKSFSLSDDSKIDIKDHLQASITEDNKPRAFLWLEEHEFDGIIKTRVNSDFGKGETEQALKAQEALTAAGFTATMDRSVHPMTLKSFVKERLEEGDSIPLDIFGVFEFKEAKITRPKEKKSRAR